MEIEIEYAKNTEVFIINDNNNIEQINLFELVMNCADKTTTPNGFAARLFVEELFGDAGSLPYLIDDPYFDAQELGDEDTITYYSISSWGANGNSYKKTGNYYISEENAKQAWFDLMVENFYQESIEYFDSENDAKNANN